MNNLGATFNNDGSSPMVYRVTPNDVVKPPAYDQQVNAIIVQILSTRKGKVILNHLLNTPFDKLLAAAIDPKLSTAQKFKKVFGVDLSTLQSSGGFLGAFGSIFDDIGSWFSNTFSNSNLSKTEDFLRRFQNQAGEFANVLNTFRNKPAYDPATDRTALDQITGTAFSINEFFSKYGIIIIGLLIGYIFITKK